MTSSKRAHQAMNDSRGGVALLLGLLVVVLLTVIIVEFSYEVQVEASLAANRDDSFAAYVAAKSAIAEGIGLLAQDLYVGDPTLVGVDPSTSDGYVDVWASSSGTRTLNDAQMITTIDDEYGKINLNALLYLDPNGAEQLVENTWLIEATRQFFRWRNPDMDTDAVDTLISSILDWMDYGDGDQTDNGAEMDYYTGLEIPYPAKNGPFTSVEELLLINGMTPELFFGDPELQEDAENGEAGAQTPLTEFFTVHGDWQGRINANTAPRDVLVGVLRAFSENPDLPQIQAGDPDQIVDAILLTHQFGESAEVGPSPLQDVSELQAYFQNTRRGNRQQQQDPNNPNDPNAPGASGSLATYFRTTSNVFRIRGDGVAEESAVRVEAFVWRQPLDPEELQGAGLPTEPFRILAWKVIR